LELNEPVWQIPESPHKGFLPQKLEFIRIGASNVIASAFKRAEDNDGFILRCFETDGREAFAKIDLPILGRAWEAKFRKCEIKTFWIPADESASVEERNLLEMLTS
jgi:alpha-mannosidase